MALVNVPLPRGQTLMHCLQDSQEQLVRQLLALGLTVDATDADGNTPVHAAAYAGHAAVLRMLLMNSADPNVLNHRRQDALMLAVRSKSRNVMVRRLMLWDCHALLLRCNTGSPDASTGA